MKKLNKHTVAKAALFLIILLALPTVYVLAGRGGSPADMGSDPSGAPIDGGISLLVAAGIGYGAKKVKDTRRKNSQIQATESATEEK